MKKPQYTGKQCLALLAANIVIFGGLFLLIRWIVNEDMTATILAVIGVFVLMGGAARA